MQRWSTVALLVVVLVAPSCRETTHRARSFDCDCSWLSDYDDASGQRVTVCAASDEDAKQAAESTVAERDATIASMLQGR